MENQVSKYRHEVKYYIRKQQAIELKLLLRGTMNLDPNADKTGSYWIRSLYFDTIDNKEYYEKILGHYNRKKIRLRIYDIDSSTVNLEIKNKFKNHILKETVTISREDAHKLIHGSYNSLLNYNEKVTNKLYAFMHSNLYRPTVIIDYEREAYFYPFQNIRVTLDKNLRATFTPRNFFKDDLCLIPLLDNKLVILEIKYNHMIPVFLQKILSNFAAQKSDISKYCIARKIIGK